MKITINAMVKKNNNIVKIDTIIQKDYPLIRTIGTYLNFDLKEKTKVESEIEIMKRERRGKEKEDN